MLLTIVGSGTVVPAGDRVCACYHVETPASRILLDCGPGALHHMARFGVAWGEVTHVVLSHFHTDHVGELPMLLFSLKHGLVERREQPLDVIGPVGTAGLLRRMADAFGEYVLDPGFPLRIREVQAGAAMALDGATALQARSVPHTTESLAYRLETADAALGYTGDTGPDDELGDFLRGVDLLLAECSLPDDGAIPIHLSPA
ncbi:MAG TPA: ribonuclease Z, partial [Longimicrobiales bacterium]